MNSATYGKRSFRFEAAHDWNSLPNEMGITTDFKEFGRGEEPHVKVPFADLTFSFILFA